MFRRTVFWQVHVAFLRKLRDFAQNPRGWCFPSAKAASTQKGFPCPGAIFPKTQTGGVPPTRKRATPKKVFLVPARFPRMAKCRCPPKRDFLERRNAVPCPNAFSPNGKTPLLAPTHFPLTAKRRSLPGRIFFKRQNAAAQKSVFFSFRFEFFSLSY